MIEAENFGDRKTYSTILYEIIKTAKNDQKTDLEDEIQSSLDKKDQMEDELMKSAKILNTNQEEPQKTDKTKLFSRLITLATTTYASSIVDNKESNILIIKFIKQEFSIY